MYCKKISYTNYRNIESAVFEPAEEVSVLYGNNAQGKTNILEGIYYFACGKSFRGVKDRELIRFSASEACVEIEFSDSVRNRCHGVRLFEKERKVCLKEGIKISRMSDFIGVFRAVLFSPEHLSIVKDGPSERRNFYDIAISQLYPAYMASLSRYKTLLANRNAALKDEPSPSSDAMLEVLSAEMAKESAFIAAHRAAYTKKLSEYASLIIDDMTLGCEKVDFFYEKGLSEQDYYRLYVSDIAKERIVGSTLHGVHKDDVEIKLNGRDSRLFASQGQQRSIALAMKIAEGEISKEQSGEYPVFLFDDILSELDKNRKNYVLSKLGKRQVIITCCEDIPTGKIFTVSNGTLS